MSRVSEATGTICLEIRGLVCNFRGVRAVTGADFSVACGQLTALVGPNGAGKSTVLNAIAGAVKPTAGSIRFRGEEIAGLAPHEVARRGIIRTFQVSSQFSRLTVLENLLVGAKGQRGASALQALRGKRSWRASEMELVERGRQLLERFGLRATENQYAGELSGGQRRMVEIMRALMADPDVLLLDEPFAGVNPTLARRVEEQLIAIREMGITTLMVEHELAAVERLSDSVVVMTVGSVLARGSMANMRSNPDVVAAYLGA